LPGQVSWLLIHEDSVPWVEQTGGWEGKGRRAWADIAAVTKKRRLWAAKEEQAPAASAAWRSCDSLPRFRDNAASTRLFNGETR